MQQEGVIKFRALHRQTPLAASLDPLANELNAWRTLLLQTGLLGRDPARYGGLGFGNISARAPGPTDAKAQRSDGTTCGFLISGTQTGGLAQLALADFCLVTGCRVSENEVTSTGETPPSSEALTHAAFYALSAQIRYVFHAHAPEIWRNADALGLPCSDANVPYGTPQMAHEVERLHRRFDLTQRPIICMGGHEDGVCSVGETAKAAGSALLCALAQARELR